MSEYSPNEERPLAGYVAAMSGFGVLVSAFAAITRKRGVKLPARIEPYDFALLSLATHKLSRIISKDAVTSPIRAPFTEYKEPAGAGELNEDVRVHGVAHGIGELLTCPFCLAVWVATSLVAGFVNAPRATRLVASTFGAVAISDALQFGYDALKKSEQ